MNADRVRVLERRVEELTRQIAGLPVRLARAGGKAKSSDATAAIFTGDIFGTIPAGQPSGLSAGSGSVFEVHTGGETIQLLGNHVFYNPFRLELEGACTLSKIAEEEWLIVGWVPELVCATATVVTSVACVDGQVQGLTDDIRYVSGPCP